MKLSELNEQYSVDNPVKSASKTDKIKKRQNTFAKAYFTHASENDREPNYKEYEKLYKKATGKTPYEEFYTIRRNDNDKTFSDIQVTKHAEGYYKLYLKLFKQGKI